MNGPHDMGGAHGFGPVVAEEDEPVFHAPWERRTFALVLAMGATGAWNIDQTRFARESLPPARYLASSYYELWLAGLERLLAARGLVGAAAVAPPGTPVRVLRAEEVATTLARGSSAARPAPRPARFATGDPVRARNIHPPGHTRLPRYVRGHAGTIERVHGCQVFPDVHARGEGEDPQWLYTVRFGGRELWGDDADPTLEVCVDLFEPHLEAL